MNRGTRIRGIALILALVLTGLALFDIVMVFSAKIVIYIFLVLAAAVGYYWNEDFTEASCHGTGVTRQIKAEAKEDYEGDVFFSDEEMDFDEADIEEIAEGEDADE